MKTVFKSGDNMNIFIFLIGSVIGSFLNVCIYRIPRNISLTFGRSKCPCCKMTIPWYRNIPLFSYLCSGNCQHCHKKIPLTYFIIELVSAIMFLFFYLQFHFSFMFFFKYVWYCICIITIFIDLHHMYIPNRIHLCILFLALIKYCLFPSFILESFISFSVIFIPLMLLYYALPHHLGGGDIKLLASSGLFFGHDIIYIFNFSIIFALLFLLYFIGYKHKTKKDPIAFGPFICSGIFLIYFL